MLSFEQVTRWPGWVLLGTVVLWCWMVLGVLVLAFLNYLVLFMDPLRPADTREWIAYSELGGLTLAWPHVLILITSRKQMLSRVLLCCIAVAGILSFGLGGWNVAGRQFDRPLDRAVSGLFLLAAAGVGQLAARRKRNGRQL
jgi:hypothetical protein